MTRIITITGGIPQTGRTQTAINLAVELVRRGRQTGVFQDAAAADTLDHQLDLHHYTEPHRRATDQPPGDILRRGYMGVDFLTCRLPLADWPAADDARLRNCIHDMDTHDGYDALLIDTSAMPAATVLGCCLAAGVVVVVVTPDPHSQAGAFALLRILRLNGFTGTLRLLVNRAPDAAAAAAIHDRLAAQVREHLGLGLPLLGSLAADPHVDTAIRSRQVFSSVYPDSEVAAAVVACVTALDAIDTGRGTPRMTVTRYWKNFLEKVRMPLQLPGQRTLAELPAPEGGADTGAPPQVTAAETGLVQFDGSLATLCDSLVTLPETLGVLARDMSELVAALSRARTVHAVPTGDACNEQECLQLAAAILNGVCASATRREHVHLQVTECRIDTNGAGWLRQGDYMRFAFRVCTQGDLPERLRAVFARLRLPLREQMEDNEVIWERMNPVRTVSLGVSVGLPDELRLILWMPGRRDAARADAAAAAQQR